MAADKYLALGTSGFPAEKSATDVSAGDEDAGKIVALNEDGKVDISMLPLDAVDESAGVGDAGKLVLLDETGKIDGTMLPNGIGEDPLLLVASESLSAGNLINIWNDSGTAKMRKADNSNGRVAHGFVTSAVSSSATGTAYGVGQINDQLSALTPGTAYFLGTSGSLTTSIPTTSGYVVQYIGTTHSATAMRFTPSTPITRA